MYSNLRGCDGERAYYYGGSTIALNGDIITRGEEFSLQDVVSMLNCASQDETRSFEESRFDPETLSKYSKLKF